MDGLIKLLFIAMLAPFFLCLVAQLVVGIAAAFLPWFILWGIVVGITAGAAVGFALRRRLPPRNGHAALPPGGFPAGAHRIRRPKGPRGRDD
jgi:hypothetical protein